MPCRCSKNGSGFLGEFLHRDMMAIRVTGKQRAAVVERDDAPNALLRF
jgi:hypothetical protein